MAEEKTKQGVKTLFTVDVNKIMTEQDQVGPIGGTLIFLHYFL